VAGRKPTAILLRGYESKDLDYKGPGEWDEGEKKACCELVKDVLGMANTKGGFVVIGVSEGPGGFSWDGLTPEQARTWDTTRFNRFLQNYSDPPINALLRKVSYESKAFVIIEVPQFSDTPHICQKEFRGVLTARTLYVRTDNNETAPIRSSADFRAVVEQATRNRSDALLTAVRSILVGGVRPQSPTKPFARDQFMRQRSDAVAKFEAQNPYKDKAYTGFREACFFPEQFEEAWLRLDQLRDAAERAHVDFTGWPFLFIHRNRPEVTYAVQNGLETLVATRDFAGNDMLDFWRFQQSGFFYQRRLMWEDTRKDRAGARLSVADFGATAAYAGEAVYCLTRLYDGLLGDDEEVSFVTRLWGTQDRRLTSLDGRRAPLWASYVCRIPDIEVEERHSMADWRAGMVDHAVSLAKEVFLRFNWERPNLEAARQIIQKMFERTL
jgi:hypothetical protein